MNIKNQSNKTVNCKSKNFFKAEKRYVPISVTKDELILEEIDELVLPENLTENILVSIEINLN